MHIEAIEIIYKGSGAMLKGRPGTSLVERRRQPSGLEQDAGILVVVAKFGIGGGREGDDPQAQGRQALGLAAGFFGGSAGDGGLRLQRLAASCHEGLDQVDCFCSHAAPMDALRREHLQEYLNRRLHPAGKY